MDTMNANSSSDIKCFQCDADEDKQSIVSNTSVVSLPQNSRKGQCSLHRLSERGNTNVDSECDESQTVSSSNEDRKFNLAIQDGALLETDDSGKELCDITNM